MGDEDEKKLEMVNEVDDTCATFCFTDEDHTLGNALRYMLMKNPDVEFCGYSVPHPNENKMNVRIQTTGIPATDALRAGLRDVSSVCRYVIDVFEDEVKEFRAMQPQPMDS